MLPDKVHGREDSQPGIPLAASGTACLADTVQGLSSHLIAQAPRFLGQWSGFCGNSQKLPRADSRPTGTPKATGPAWYGLAPAVHFPEGLLQIKAPSGIPVGGEQGRSNHHMVFRAVHMAEGHIRWRIPTGSVEVSERHRPKMLSMPWVWQSLQT